MKFGTTFVLAVALWPSVLPAQQHVAPQALVPGEAVEREIAAGDSHLYNIQVSQGQYLHAVVHPSGVSLGVVLLDGPGGKQLAGFVANPGAAPNLFSLTSLHWIAHTSGIYRLELRVVQGNHGSYELKTDRLRAPTPQDRDRASGAEVFSVACEEYDRQRARVSMAPNAPPSQLLVKLDEALKLMNDAGDLGAEVDISNTKSAVALDIGEYDAALAASSHGLTLARRLGDQARENKTLLQLILIYSIFGDYQKVLNSSFQAFQLGYASGSTNLQFERTQVVGAYIKLGEPESAIEFLNAFPPEADDPINRAAALLDLGDAYTEMKQAGKAIEDLDGALSLAVTMHNKPMEGRASISLSRAYQQLGVHHKAAEYAITSATAWEAAGFKRFAGLALASAGAELYAETHDAEASRKYLDQAIGVVASEPPAARSAVLDSVADAYEQMGDLARAAQCWHQTVSIAQMIGADTMQGLYRLAKLSAERGDLFEARKEIEKVLDVAESKRSRILSQDLRESYPSSVSAYYDFYVDLLVRLHSAHAGAKYDAMALEIHERGRARALLETLAESRAQIHRGGDPKLLDREHALQRMINAKVLWQQQTLGRRHRDAEAATVKYELEDLLREYQVLEAQIRVTSPHYATLTHPHPLRLAQIQKTLLDPTSIMLEYALGDEHSYLWIVTQDSLDLVELPKRHEIDALARQFYALAAKRDVASVGKAQRDDRDEYLRVARDLSRFLLGRVALPRLQGRRLLIVGDGALEYIPFGALPDPSEHDFVPLMAGHEIVYLPSASVMAVMRNETAGRRTTSKTVAVLADPVFEKNDTRIKAVPGTQRQTAGGVRSIGDEFTTDLALERSVRQTGISHEGLRVPRLPFTRQEAEGIYALTLPDSAMKALDFRADLQTATSQQISQYRILHFATHGLLNSEHPALSGLILSLVDEEGRPKNGFLKLQDIYNMELNADLVVLSACQTALGREIKGEGLVGLTRGFIYAGAKGVVASLWRVDDLATAELMKVFYRGMLLEGLRPAAALRAAQLAMWKKRSSPYYWAGFVLQGEWQ